MRITMINGKTENEIQADRQISYNQKGQEIQVKKIKKTKIKTATFLPKKSEMERSQTFYGNGSGERSVYAATVY